MQRDPAHHHKALLPVIREALILHRQVCRITMKACKWHQQVLYYTLVKRQEFLKDIDCVWVCLYAILSLNMSAGACVLLSHELDPLTVISSRPMYMAAI